MIDSLYNSKEMELLLNIGKNDQEKKELVHAPRDAEGRESKLWLTSETEQNDIYNAICHGHRIVDTMEALMRDEVYLYHYKMMVVLEFMVLGLEFILRQVMNSILVLITQWHFKMEKLLVVEIGLI